MWVFMLKVWYFVVGVGVCKFQVVCWLIFFFLCVLVLVIVVQLQFDFMLCKEVVFWLVKIYCVVFKQNYVGMLMYQCGNGMYFICIQYYVDFFNNEYECVEVLDGKQ